eukprot:5515207-Prymnesium_polylepis.1
MALGLNGCTRTCALIRATKVAPRRMSRLAQRMRRKRTYAKRAVHDARAPRGAQAARRRPHRVSLRDAEQRWAPADEPAGGALPKLARRRRNE